MFRHVVSFKLADDKKDRKEEAKRRLIALIEIPEVKAIEVGIDQEKSERSYDLVIIVDFASEEDYKIYDQHELHLPVRKFMQTIIRCICFGRLFSRLNFTKI